MRRRIDWLMRSCIDLRLKTQTLPAVNKATFSGMHHSLHHLKQYCQLKYKVPLEIEAILNSKPLGDVSSVLWAAVITNSGLGSLQNIFPDWLADMALTSPRNTA